MVTDARSSTVRAGVVTGNPFVDVISSAKSLRRCARMPFRRRACCEGVSVTSITSPRRDGGQQSPLHRCAYMTDYAAATREQRSALADKRTR